MNERIRELAGQAGVDFGSVTQDYFGEWFPAITSTEKIDFEKFAQLIVRECIDIAVKEEHWAPQQGPVEIKIREHFGVEE